MAATMAGTALPTIADVVAGNPDFSTLLEVLKAAKLADMFTKPGTYTVFAPTNEAFAAALKMMGQTAAQLEAQPAILTKVLTYHVLGKVVLAADLMKLTNVTTVEGEDIAVSLAAAPMATMSAAMNSTVSVVKDAKLGPYLVGPDGKTLYMFKKDTAGVSNCSGGCAKIWPALTVATGVMPSASADATGKLATITRDDGTLQVTYNGMPLYYFSKDVAAGDTNGQGVGNNWFVVAPMNSTTVNVVKDAKLGPYLVGPDGKTLYMFKKDTAGVSNCSGGCAKIWPALTVATGVMPSASADATGKLATITRDDGTLQVTYNGMPLYYFSKDVAAGDTNGQAVGNNWFVVAP